MLALLIDGPNLIRRIYAGVPVVKNPEDHGKLVIESCVSSLCRALNSHQPTHVVCAMDARETSWRRDLFPSYKKNRKPMPNGLKEIWEQIIQVFHDEGVRTIEVANFEADDLIATISRKIEKAGGLVTILSTDKSFFQLIAGSIRIYDHFANQTRDREYVQQKFGIEPEQIVDLFSLAGDASLNIRGARGIGLQTGVKLLTKYGSLDELLESVGQLEGAHGEQLKHSVNDVMLARRLLVLCTGVAVGDNLKKFRYSP